MLANVKCLHISSFDSIFWTQYSPKISILKYKVHVTDLKIGWSITEYGLLVIPLLMRQRHQDLQDLLVSDSR